MSSSFSSKPEMQIEKASHHKDEVDEEMARLEEAAKTGKASAFLAVQKAMAWEKRSPKDYIQAIQWALSVGAHLVARHLSAQGAGCYPHHAELQKYAHILAPPKVTRSDLPPDPTLTTNQAWLKSHRDAFLGQWVAIREGQLLGSAASLKSLVDQIDDTKDTFLTKVC